MEFCPTCGTLLQLELAQGTQKCRFFCPTCPYVCSIERKIKKKEHLVKKQVDAIFSGAEALKYAPKTKANCPHCNYGEAYFRQMQIRSADEPMTTFYKCANEHCSREWRED
ncbi:hypothetical protein MRB53_009339 [Persea americana]|uniref:Uncharacterized protein n=1 Tax=Persea americana TaxID=3435 RepID=A0ACC2LPS3_PERAE|nr:hypothetical protein MRB53_009339 [Persea americana]|eukprot:TRINITY_DN1695_c1_g1_i2.p1 TRINITY_DN1695_c1_g1~~TRINITY_DN1695_c1_g1_i2.p1  ORF type:complete len:111 (-),score=17.52 TRINITY_DN1695_c1_g1_i2:319-651(-)